LIPRLRCEVARFDLAASCRSMPGAGTTSCARFRACARKRRRALVRAWRWAL